MNKEELLKAIEQKRQEIWPTDTHEMAPATVPNNLEQGWLNALTWMEKYINSLPTEQPSEELVDAARNIRDTLYLKEGKRDEYGNPYFLQDTLLKAFIAGADWQKEQMMKGFCYETKVYRDEEGDGIDTPIESWLALENNEITNLPNIGLKDGDNVKVIIVKGGEK